MMEFGARQALYVHNSVPRLIYLALKRVTLKQLACSIFFYRIVCAMVGTAITAKRLGNQIPRCIRPSQCAT